MFILIIKALILGVVEGVTEFLPISSTGHLIIINQWVSFGPDFTRMFDIVIQLGAILAVVVYFWQKIWPVGKDEDGRKEVFSIWKKSIIAVIPAIIIGGLIGSFIENKLFNPWVVAASLIIGGVILIVIEKRRVVEDRLQSISQMSYKTAFAIGLIQCFSMIPGVSRAAATIVGGMLLGSARSVAVEFSFFLAIPTMIAASGYSLIKHGGSVGGGEVIALIIGFVAAFAVALAVIKFFIKYIQKHNFVAFGYYRVVVGIIIIVYFLL